MEDVPATAIPDDRNWVFLGATGAPVDAQTTPMMASLPMTEVRRIFELIAYLNQQVDRCHVQVKAAPH